ncbi:hypothetical protein ACFSX5_04740 [Devosia albogilva]|uniref:Uncharacterized protein n=1 Tax=Devosia albogilva TaxID=429726 RepID=A0ABW5QHR5_9HYPH
MLLVWSASEMMNAENMFATIAARAPERRLQNKFPTNSMPCRDWAHGEQDGWRLDVRLGLFNQYHEIQITSGPETVAAALRRLQPLYNSFDPGSFCEPVLKLKIISDRIATNGSARRWNDANANPQSTLPRQPFGHTGRCAVTARSRKFTAGPRDRLLTIIKVQPLFETSSPSLADLVDASSTAMLHLGQCSLSPCGKRRLYRKCI